jgi:hypothetical protein
MTEISDSAFVTIVQYIFGDWWVWLRFTVTMVLLRRIVGDAIMKGGSTFWSFMVALVNKKNKE